MTATLKRPSRYEALDANGKRVKGKVEADDDRSAAAAAAAPAGLIPLSIAEAGTGLQKDLKIPGLGGTDVAEGSRDLRPAVRAR